MSEDNGEKPAVAPVVPPVVATIALTQQDLAAGIVEMSVLFRIRGAFLGLVVLMDIFLWRTGGQMTSGVVVPQLLTFMGFAALTYLSPWLNARRQLQALIRAGDVNVTYRFDDEGITIRSAGATSSVAYRRLVKVRRGKTALLLYTTPHIANIVPLRAFSADELARVLAFLPPDAKPQKLRSGTRLVILWVSLVLAFMVTWQFLSSRPTTDTRRPVETEVPSAR